MATALLTDESSDFVTCPVCLTEYDDLDDSRKPKFLTCSHSFCLQCLKAIRQAMEGDGSLICPLCRKISLHAGDVSLLPNNPYVIYIMNERKKSRTTISKPNEVGMISWCLTCESIAANSDYCAIQQHTLVDMPTESLTMTNLVALQSLKQFHILMKDAVRSKVAKVILEKKDVQSYLEHVSLALKTAAADVDRLKEENGTMVAELSSLMESGLLAESPSKEEESRAFRTLLECCRTVDFTSNAAKDKIKESYQEIEQKANVCMAHPAGKMVDQQAKTRITVQLTDAISGTPMTGLKAAMFTTGFVVKLQDISKTSGMTANLKNMLLISHVIFSFLNRNGGMSISKQSSTTPLLAISSLPPQIQPTPSSSFMLGQSSLVISSDQKQPGNIPQGQLRIRPSGSLLTFDPNFVRQLGQFCYRSPKQLLSSISKVFISLIFIRLQYQLHEFLGRSGCVSRPSNIIAGSGFFLEPKDPEGLSAGQLMPNRPLEVGYIKWKSSTVNASGQSTSAIGWALLFVLDHFVDPKYEHHAASLPPASHLGTIEAGAELVSNMSRVSGKERPSYSFTLESL